MAPQSVHAKAYCRWDYLFHRVSLLFPLSFISIHTVVFPRNVYFSISDLLQDRPALDISVTIFLQLTSFTTITPLIPRFIISVREIYDRDSRGRLQVDTGFGASGRPVDDEDALVSAIAFADRNPGQDQDQAAEDDAVDSEGIRLEARAGGAR